MDDPFRYRNKIVSPFAPGGKKGSATNGKRKARGKGSKASSERHASKSHRAIMCGMYAAHTHRIVPADSCLVENEVGRRVIAAIRQVMGKYGVEPYDEDAGTGFMRHAVIRVGHESGEVLVTLVTNESRFTGAKNFCHEMVKRCPEITTIVQNINTRRTNVILGGEERVLYGPGFILDTLCGLSFRLSSQTFYQVNALQTEVLYRHAIQMAHLCTPLYSTNRTVVLDAYCGTGSIGLVAATGAEHVQVIGVDNVESAIRDARQNAMHNGIENADFCVGDAGAFMEEYAAAGKRVDVLLMDPPRSGASERFLDATLRLHPSRIVYISCNPATQVRDIRRLDGYRLAQMQPVDMFPHTDHIENICLLTAKETETR